MRNNFESRRGNRDERNTRRELRSLRIRRERSQENSSFEMLGLMAMLLGVGALGADAILVPESTGMLTPAGIVALIGGYLLTKVK